MTNVSQTNSYWSKYSDSFIHIQMVRNQTVRGRQDEIAENQLRRVSRLDPRYFFSPLTYPGLLIVHLSAIAMNSPSVFGIIQQLDLIDQFYFCVHSTQSTDP